jgi:hypothetical protein
MPPGARVVQWVRVAAAAPRAGGSSHPTRPLPIDRPRIPVRTIEGPVFRYRGAYCLTEDLRRPCPPTSASRTPIATSEATGAASSRPESRSPRARMTPASRTPNATAARRAVSAPACVPSKRKSGAATFVRSGIAGSTRTAGRTASARSASRSSPAGSPDQTGSTVIPPWIRAWTTPIATRTPTADTRTTRRTGDARRLPCAAAENTALGRAHRSSDRKPACSKWTSYAATSRRRRSIIISMLMQSVRDHVLSEKRR